MRTLRLLSVLLAALTLTLALAAGSAARSTSPAAAQERMALPQPAKSQPAPPALATSPTATQRSFVSGLGSDTNPCSRTAPCRNFTKAISETLANGEVIVLDSAGYGPFTIDKSIDIIAPAGVYAGVTAFSGDAVTINAAATDRVVLRGLTLNGLGGSIGINVQSVGTLYVQQLVMKKFGAIAGLFVGGSGSPRVFVEDTLAHDNFAGVWLYFTGTPEASLEDTRLEHNTHGVLVAGGKATARGVVATGNSSGGFRAEGGGQLNLEHAVAANNVDGIQAVGVGAVRVSETMITNNTGAAVAGPGMRLSWGNNRVAGNGSDCCFSGTIPMQ